MKRMSASQWLLDKEYHDTVVSQPKQPIVLVSDVMQRYYDYVLEDKCREQGHVMYSVYVLNNERSSWGLHKCSRCGYEEPWQYDHI